MEQQTVELVVRQIMSTDYPTVVERDSAVQVAKKMGKAAWAVTVVGEGGDFRGLVTQADIVRQVASKSNLDTVSADQLAKPYATVGPEETVEAAAELMAEHAPPILPVTDDGRLLGVVTRADLDAFRRLAGELGPRVADMNTQISPNDNMNAGLRGHYFVAGASALRCVRESLASAGIGPPNSVLDLPSGYGRVLRVLRAAYPQAAFTACDIDRDAVDFCGNVLGASPVYSEPDPREIPIHDRFDLIWVGSLFTHFPARRWREFLDFFAEHLTPDGLLMFTTLRKFASPSWIGLNEQRGKEIREQYAQTGYGYIPQRGADLGISIASPEWVKEQINAHPTLVLHRFDEDAWEPVVPRHDVTTCGLRKGAAVGGLQATRPGK